MVAGWGSLHKPRAKSKILATVADNLWHSAKPFRYADARPKWQAFRLENAAQIAAYQKWADMEKEYYDNERRIAMRRARANAAPDHQAAQQLGDAGAAADASEGNTSADAAEEEVVRGVKDS